MAKAPSDKQIKFANKIATTLNIDFPNNSSDFTSFAYYNFIKEHIEEYNNCCRDGIIEEFGNGDIFWGYEYGLWEY